MATQALQERRADKHIVTEIGDIFLSQIGMFKLYAVYCSNQHQVVKMLRTYQEQNPELREFLEVHRAASYTLRCVDSTLTTMTPFAHRAKYTRHNAEA